MGRKCRQYIRECLIHAERAYLEIAKRNKYHVINCIESDKVRSIEDINQELFRYVAKELGINIGK